MSAERTERLRVLIADDHRVVREQLATLLNAEEDMQVVGLAPDGDGALDQAKALTPDVLIIDQNMPGPLSGLDVIRALRRAQLATRVVMYTMATEVCDAARAAGAAACISKDAPYDMVLDAVRAAGAFSLARSVGSQRRERGGGRPERGTTAMRVLVVDDDAGIRDVLSEALRGVGFEVTSAANGEDALRECARGDPDVIVVDLLMPVMGGRAFLQAYRRRSSARAKVVLLSALPSAAQIAHELGCDAGYSKPFDLDELVATVDALAVRG